jgi:hypothetical protein
MASETNEQDKSPESRKLIYLTSQENLTLMMADPESAEVKAIMDAHGIEFGEPVEANVDGVRMVVETSKEDFWTRNRKATAELVSGEGTFEQEAAEHAQNLMEATSEHDQLVEVVAEPMGETAVDEIEAEAGLPLEPFEEAAPEGTKERPEFDHQELGSVSEMAMSLQRMRDGFIHDDAETARHLIDDIVARQANAASDMYARGEMSQEAYSLVMGVAFGGAETPGLTSHVKDMMRRSELFSNEEMSILEQDYSVMMAIKQEAGEMRTDAIASRIYTLQQIANDTLERNGGVATSQYYAMLGEIAGLGSMLTGENSSMGYNIAHGAFEQALSVKK